MCQQCLVYSKELLRVSAVFTFDRETEDVRWRRVHSFFQKKLDSEANKQNAGFSALSNNVCKDLNHNTLTV